MNIEDIMLCEIKLTQNDKNCMIYLYEVPRTVKFIETEILNWPKKMFVQDFPYLMENPNELFG